MPLKPEDDIMIRWELDRLLASPVLKDAERLKRLLIFIVTETLAGRATQMKEYVLGLAVFDKSPDFDPRIDPIARIQVGRLRAKLSEYYQGDGRHNPIRIEVPRGSYVAAFHRQADARSASLTEYYQGGLHNLTRIEVPRGSYVAESHRQADARSAAPIKSHLGSSNQVAYNAQLQGRYHWNSYWNDHSEEQLLKAIEHFEAAIGKDPRSAIAYSGLADCYSLLGFYRIISPIEAWKKAAWAAETSVRTDWSLAEGHTSLAGVKAGYGWDWIGAEAEFLEAIDLNPRYPIAHLWYARTCLAPLARLDEAIDEVLFAQTLMPSARIMSHLAAVLYFNRDFAAAIEQCNRTIELDPTFAAPYSTLAMVHEQLGHFDKAATILKKGMQLAPKDSQFLGEMGRTLGLSGNKAGALSVLKELDQLIGETYVSPFQSALIHLALGDRDRGFQLLDKAAEERCLDLTCIAVDPRLDIVGSDARFESLVAKLGLRGQKASSQSRSSREKELW